MRVLRAILGALLLAQLAGCASEVGSSPAEVAAARYATEEAPYVSVLTMVYQRSGRAAHSALLINGSQRVLYDPAGTFQHPDLTERGDIHYGVTDRMLDYYLRYHARFSHFVHEQRIYVSGEVAEATLRRAVAQGPSPKMWCNIHVTKVLNDVGAFGRLRSSFYPEKLRRQIARLPGVRDSYTYENDRGKTVPIN